MSIDELNRKYFVSEVRRKKKGAGKGYKEYVELCFNENYTRRDYLRELAEVDKSACGLFLCKIEFSDLTEDRWWDTPDYRATHLKDYRRRITELRKEYGLRSADVAEFMKVG